MSVSRVQLVRRAGVDEDYVHRLHELGALLGHDDAYEERDVHVAALLHVGARGAAEALALPHELHAVGLPSAQSRGVPRTLRTEEKPVVEEEDQLSKTGLSVAFTDL
jgi:hypothetical protein